jgi:hypothetical protein
MLSGRKVSGLEVVQRLERLEKVHAGTVSELSETKQKLEEKEKQIAAAGESKRDIKPRYNDGEIRKLLDVMATLREIADAKIAPKTWELSEYRNSWERKLKEGGVAATSAYVQSFAEPVRSALNDINNILYDYQHYADQVRPVVEGFDVVGAFHSASVDLAKELSDYADARNVDVGKILNDRFQRWFSASNDLGNWVGQTDARITTKTKQLREWNQ